MDRTQRNLWSAFLGEAKANRMYLAYALKALEEGHPEVAQVFMEAAGAETVHALSHLRVLGEVRSTLENLRAVTEGEAYEFETMYPRFVREAEDDGRPDAAESFRLALEGEREHLKRFRAALQHLERKTGQKAPAPPRPSAVVQEMPAPEVVSLPQAAQEVLTEKQRIARLARIREVIFGMQDGLVTAATVGPAVAGATATGSTVIVAGLAAVLGGTLSMSAGSFLGSRAERQVQEAELAREAWEIENRPEEEMAELIEIYRLEGFTYDQAREMAERVAADKGLWLKTMAEKELGLSSETLPEPSKDALAMGASYLGGGVLPIIPYFFAAGAVAVAASIAIAVAALFAIGAVKGLLVRRNPLLSGAEVTAVGGIVAVAAYFLGRIAPV
ncbi:MAG TPA: VIT1/CCC1 transporter family protein [Dehalococcoidia bacterium]|nr:VIT1/CCC1 transporter family protein [Dehalococcoidia bacterium]